MRYLFLICGEESTTGVESITPDTDLEPINKWVEEMDSRGVRTFGSALQPTSASTMVRVRDGAVLATDGPFAETKEQILGFDLIECDDLDQAIEVAAKHPAAKDGAIEVRPLWPS
jgi:hypothetical protein